MAGGIVALESAFIRIATSRMAGVGLCHPGLTVKAIGFRPHDTILAGVLLTPWAMSLTVLPGGAQDAAALRLGPDCREIRTFPSGDYEFMGGSEPECGAFQFCPLFSPMAEFEDQGAAESTAWAVVEALFTPVNAMKLSRCKVTGQGAPVAVLPSFQTPLTRRGFFRSFRPAGGL